MMEKMMSMRKKMTNITRIQLHHHYQKGGALEGSDSTTKITVCNIVVPENCILDMVFSVIKCSSEKLL
jgi:hypothetical protein